MGWRGLFRQPLARQCNSICCISANTENIPPGFRLPGLSSPQHNFQLTSIFLEFCQHTAGFTCPGWTLENPVSVNPQKQDNCKLSHIYLIFLMHFLLYSDNIWLYTGLLLRAAWWMPVFTLLLAFTPETY